MYTSEERDSMEVRIAEEVNHMYEGSLLRQMKFDTLIALNDENEEYFRKKSFRYSRRGQFDIAYPLMEEAIKLDPLNALYFTSWQKLFIYRNYEDALEDLHYYDDISEGVNYVWGENINYLKGLAYKQLGMYDEAVAEFDKCIAHEGDGTSEYVYVYRGISNLRHECLDDAIEDFKKAISKYSNCTMAYVYMGEAFLQMQALKEARTYLSQAEDLLCKHAKKTHPYFEVFDEVQLVQVYDLLDRARNLDSTLEM
jgi:tetratricopeptide (TPR) repeat protein